MLGKKEESLEMATKAVHLAGAKDRSKTIEITGAAEIKAKSREDTFKIRKPVQKHEEAKLVKTIVNNTQVLTKSKYEFTQVNKSLGQPRHIPMK